MPSAWPQAIKIDCIEVLKINNNLSVFSIPRLKSWALKTPRALFIYLITAFFLNPDIFMIKSILIFDMLNLMLECAKITFSAIKWLN